MELGKGEVVMRYDDIDLYKSHNVSYSCDIGLKLKFLLLYQHVWGRIHTCGS